MTAPDEATQHPPNAPLAPLEEPFTDDRGVIQPLVEAEIKSALLISSKQGAVRATHYHLTDWHYLYVLSGEMAYYYRPANNTEPPELLTVRAGQMVFTPPMVEHRIDFLQDTVCLTLSRNPRDQASYEADVVRVQMPAPPEA